MQKKKRFQRPGKKLFIGVSAIGTILVVILLSGGELDKRTYVITDGSRVTVHTTSATDPRLVLGEAGLALGENDTYTTEAGDGSSQINVRRGRNLVLDYYGKQLEVQSHGESVEELLIRLGLTWSDSDTVSPSLETETYEGMQVRIARTVRENQTYTTSLPYETIYCSDGALPEGTKRIVTEGERGQLLCEAAVTYQNGVETERAVVSRQVLSQPVSRIVAVGTGPSQEEEEENALMPIIGDGIITLPTGEVLTYIEKVQCLATAYCCEGYVGTTATGTRARVGAIAVDPEVFPYGTRFYIHTRDGEYIYGIATAEDCGSKEFIYGTRLDLYFNTKRECIQFGARSCDVYILG